MATILYKWFFTASIFLCLTGSSTDPIYVSVTEIEYNAREKSVEVSCKIFTDDFEKTLRAAYKTNVDLINPKDKVAMDKLINDYVQKHMMITADGKRLNLKYIGYEIIEEGVYSYYEATNIEKLNSVSIFNNILYEYNAEQMGLVHVTVNGNTKSTKLSNPVDKASIVF
mgnify:FL=1